MDSLITFIVAPIVLIVGISAAFRRPAARDGLGTLRVTRRKRVWNDGALAERAADRLRGGL
jgi:hypothetical protein